MGTFLIGFQIYSNATNGARNSMSATGSTMTGEAIQSQGGDEGGGANMIGSSEFLTTLTPSFGKPQLP